MQIGKLRVSSFTQRVQNANRLKPCPEQGTLSGGISNLWIWGESPQPDGFEVRNLNRIQYAIENHSQAVPIWLRSACLYNVYDVWCATLNGFVYGCSAQLAYNNRVAPACVVC